MENRRHVRERSQQSSIESQSPQPKDLLRQRALKRSASARDLSEKGITPLESDWRPLKRSTSARDMLRVHQWEAQHDNWDALFTHFQQEIKHTIAQRAYLEQKQADRDHSQEDYNHAQRNEVACGLRVEHLIEKERSILIQPKEGIMSAIQELSGEYENPKPLGERDDKERNYDLLIEELRTYGMPLEHSLVMEMRKQELKGKDRRTQMDSIIDLYQNHDHHFNMEYVKGEMRYLETKKQEKCNKMAKEGKEFDRRFGALNEIQEIHNLRIKYEEAREDKIRTLAIYNKYQSNKIHKENHEICKKNAKEAKSKYVTKVKDIKAKSCEKVEVTSEAQEHALGLHGKESREYKQAVLNAHLAKSSEEKYTSSMKAYQESAWEAEKAMQHYYQAYVQRFTTQGTVKIANHFEKVASAIEQYKEARVLADKTKHDYEKKSQVAKELDVDQKLAKVHLKESALLKIYKIMRKLDAAISKREFVRVKKYFYQFTLEEAEKKLLMQESVTNSLNAKREILKNVINACNELLRITQSELKTYNNLKILIKHENYKKLICDKTISDREKEIKNIYDIIINLSDMKEQLQIRKENKKIIEDQIKQVSLIISEIDRIINMTPETKLDENYKYKLTIKFDKELFENKDYSIIESKILEALGEKQKKEEELLEAFGKDNYAKIQDFLLIKAKGDQIMKLAILAIRTLKNDIQPHLKNKALLTNAEDQFKHEAENLCGGMEYQQNPAFEIMRDFFTQLSKSDAKPRRSNHVQACEDALEKIKGLGNKLMEDLLATMRDLQATLKPFYHQIIAGIATYKEISELSVKILRYTEVAHEMLSEMQKLKYQEVVKILQASINTKDRAMKRFVESSKKARLDLAEVNDQRNQTLIAMTKNSEMIATYTQCIKELTTNATSCEEAVPYILEDLKKELAKNTFKSHILDGIQSFCNTFEPQAQSPHTQKLEAIFQASSQASIDQMAVQLLALSLDQKNPSQAVVD